MAIAKIEPTGCGEFHGNVKVRLAFYLEPDDARYNERYYLVPVIPPEGYPGKVDEQGSPVDFKAYESWLNSLPHIWRLVPFHNHFLYFNPDVTEDEIKAQASFHLPNFYAAWLQELDKIKGGMRKGWAIETRARPIRYDITDPELYNLRKPQCLEKVQLIKALAIEVKGGEGEQLFPATAIDIGAAATDRVNTYTSGWTRISKENPANDTGTITSIEVWADVDLADFEVATFIDEGSNTFSTRDIETIGSVTAGSKQTFSGLDMDVATGDYIGNHFTSGAIDALFAGDGVWSKQLDQIPCTSVTFTFTTGRTISLYGTGATAAETYTKTVNIDALLRETDIKTVDIDAYIKAVDTKTVDLDTLLKELGITETVNLDALLKEFGITETVNLDTLLALVKQIETVDLDVLLQALGITKEVAIDALLKATDAKTVNLDILVKELGIAKTVALDVILGLLQKTVELDVLLKAIDTKMVDLDVLILALKDTKTIDLDTLLKVVATKTVDIDVLLRALGVTKTADIDTLIRTIDQKTVNVDALLEALDTETIDVDTLLRTLGVTKTVDLDTLLETIDMETVNLDVLLRELGITKTIDLDILLALVKLTQIITIDTFLEKTDSKAIDLDTYLRALNVIATVDLDALIQSIGITKTVVLDALLKAVDIKTISLDALLKGLGITKTVALDALIRGADTKMINLDALIRGIATKTIQLDVILWAYPTGALGYIIEVRDSSGNLLAILENAHRINLVEELNRPPMLDFNLPADDNKISHINPDNEVWLRDYETGVLMKRFLISRRSDTRK